VLRPTFVGVWDSGSSGMLTTVFELSRKNWSQRRVRRKWGYRTASQVSFKLFGGLYKELRGIAIISVCDSVCRSVRTENQNS